MQVYDRHDATALREVRRARGFFWTELILATATSVSANAAHAWLNATTMSPVLAASVAAIPPLVQLGCTEGASLMVRVRVRSTVIYWAAIALTILVGLAAFRLSFDALTSLAVQCGVRPSIAPLWPAVVDVCITQSTLCLLALPRLDPPPTAAATADVDDRVNERAEALGRALNPADSADPGSGRLRALAAPDEQTVRALVDSRRTKQSPETVAAVLAQHEAGQKAPDIADRLGLHHTTVKRIIANRHRQPALNGSH